LRALLGVERVDTEGWVGGGGALLGMEVGGVVVFWIAWEKGLMEEKIAEGCYEVEESYLG
jgi:hypothetical protein